MIRKFDSTGKMKKISFFILSCLFASLLYGQEDSTKLFKKRKIALGTTTAVVYSASVVMLNELWYKDYKTRNFHFFDDNAEWLQLDKYGHTYTTYQIGLAGIQTMRWAGVKEKNAVWLGGFVGSFYMTTIELFDGFSDGWGFSWGDMAANTSGSLLAILQERYWKEQRIQLKFSFYPSTYAQYRPNLLGKNFGEQLLKDYNGQTYWVSCNISSFLKKENKFPKWLNLAFGAGADGMTGGHENIIATDKNGVVKDFKRQRQYYLSLDADLTRIQTKSKFLKKVFRVVNIVKIPFPALEFSGGKLKGVIN
jgi:hypothetical protein